MVSYFFYPDYSGSSVQAFNLSRRLLDRGIVPRIVSANLSGAARSEIRGGVAVERLPTVTAMRGALPSFWMSLAWHLIRHHREYDILHAHGTIWHQIVGLIGRLLRKKSILKIAMWQSDLAFDRQGRMVGAVNALLVKQFDRYIATTPEIAEEIASRGLDRARIRYIPNGVDTATHRPLSEPEKGDLRRRLGLPASPVVAFVGILNSRKNIDGLLRIWKMVVDQGHPGHLIVVGPSPAEDAGYLRQLTEFAQQHHLDQRVSLLGRRDDVSACLQASDIFVFPSRQEGMPNAVLEAMSTGLPCVVSSGTGIDRVVADGVSGFLLPGDDEGAFAGVVGRLLDQPELRARVGARARQVILESFSLDAVADRYVALYGELLSSTMPSTAMNGGPEALVERNVNGKD
jgi:glycosyltransferase involved in cell wall biosynthesis